MRLLLEKEQVLEIITAPNHYPRLVNGKDFSIVQRIMAKQGMANVGNQLFLGYCNIHKKYYLDQKHTNDAIRCPVCDAKWLYERGIIK